MWGVIRLGREGPNGRVRLDRLDRLRVPLLSTVGKYFLFVRTGIGASQIDPGDFNLDFLVHLQTDIKQPVK